VVHGKENVGGSIPRGLRSLTIVSRDLSSLAGFAADGSVLNAKKSLVSW
jgi:hypothetical protein